MGVDRNIRDVLSAPGTLPGRKLGVRDLPSRIGRCARQPRGSTNMAVIPFCHICRRYIRGAQGYRTTGTRALLDARTLRRPLLLDRARWERPIARQLPKAALGEDLARRSRALSLKEPPDYLLNHLAEA